MKLTTIPLLPMQIMWAKHKNRHQFPNVPFSLHQAKVRWISTDGRGSYCQRALNKRLLSFYGLGMGLRGEKGGQMPKSEKNQIRVDKSVLVRILNKEASEWRCWAWSADKCMSMAGPEVLSPWLQLSSEKYNAPVVYIVLCEEDSFPAGPACPLVIAYRWV